MRSRNVQSAVAVNLDSERVTPANVVAALRVFQDAEGSRRRLDRGRLGLGESDFMALHHLWEAETAGHAVTPKSLAHKLGLTSSAMTLLVDRMVAAELMRREPHPTDRRAVLLRPASLDLAPYALFDEQRSGLVKAAEGLDAREAAIVAAFLLRAAGSLDAESATKVNAD